MFFFFFFCPIKYMFYLQVNEGSVEMYLAFGFALLTNSTSQLWILANATSHCLLLVKYESVVS